MPSSAPRAKFKQSLELIGEKNIATTQANPERTGSSGAKRRRRARLADPKAREFLRGADPVMARLIDARPDFRPRAWMDQLPPLDGFGTLIFQVTGQQLLVALDRPDVFLPGDLALRRAVARAYGLDHSPTEEEMAELAERWRPYRSLAVSCLFASEYDA